MLKLYYWNCLDTIADYMCGCAFALANNKEDAIDLLVVCYATNKDLRNKFREELERTDPMVYDAPYGDIIYGSA